MKALSSFKYALEGIWHTIKTERHMRIHIVVAVYVLFFAQFFELSAVSYALLYAVTAAVPAAELINTAAERICNAVTKKENPLIKAAKDAAAGAVLVCAAGAVAVGICLFWKPEKIWEIIFNIASTPELITIFILSLIISVLFIVMGPTEMGKNAASYISRDKDDK